MRVPLLDLKAQLNPLREEILAAVTEVIDSTCYIMGPKIEALEEQVAAYCGVRHAIGVSSGTDALLAALMGLGVGPGDLVLTTPYSFFATMGSILRLGARPLFADIDPVTYNLDPEQAARVLDEAGAEARKVKALIPVHLYGQCAEMAGLLKLADRYNLPVVEDAAQAIGAAYPMAVDGTTAWQRAGTMGAGGCFSFFPSKNLGGIGDGGMVVTNRDQYAEQLRIIRVHGGAPKYHHPVVGGNFRLDAIQAAVLEIKLGHLPDWHRARRRNGARYDRLFEQTGLLEERLVAIPRAVYRQQAEQETNEPDYHIYNQYVIRVADRDGLQTFLRQEGIGTEVYYPVPLHQQGCVRELGYDRLYFPETEKAAAETLALPIYPELTAEMQELVVDRIVAYYK